MIRILFSIAILSFAWVGNAANSIVTNREFSEMSHLQKISKLIWIKGDSISNIKEIIQSHSLRGIYTTDYEVDWTSSTFQVAIEIGEDFSKIFGYELPNFEVVSAVSDEQLLMDFAALVRKKGVQSGYDHMVLPISADSNFYLSRTFEMLNQFDSAYFPYKSEFEFNPSTKRKEFYPSLVGKKGVVIEEARYSSFEKTIRKEPRNYHLWQKEVLNILNKPQEEIELISTSQTKLLDQILLRSVIPYRKSSDILPIQADSIAFWSLDDQSLLEAKLNVYFRTILNVKFDRIPSGVPVIIDARKNPLLASEFAYQLQGLNPVIWVGSIESMINVNAQAYLYTGESSEKMDYILAEMIYGSEGVFGVNPRTPPVFLTDYNSRPILSQHKLGFADPAWAGLSGDHLDSIDFLAKEMIDNHGTPGAQVLVAKNGKVVFNKSYGYLTYDSLIAVDENTLYDLASLTKVTSTLMAVMKLVDQGHIHLDSTLGNYLPDYVGTNKESIKIRDLLVHQSGLQSYIPFWKRSLRGDLIDVFYYKTKIDEDSDRRSYGHGPDPVMLDSLQNWIKDSRTSAKEKPEYRYSDIGFMILHELVEKVSESTFESYLMSNFYIPLGMHNTVFNPLAKNFELFQIAPTEYDYYFREEQVWGAVHDRNAAIFGGVAGHAGLFSTSRDLAILLQMLLQNGEYARQLYLSSHILDKFNKRQYSNNRRGLGWDKPGEFNPNISELASNTSFGHTGFTGTMIWADPEHDLVFIFLSNRIFPNSENKNLIKLDTRRRMQEVVYQSMAEFDKRN